MDSLFGSFGNFIAGNAALSGAPEPFHICHPFVGVFGGATLHPLPPALPARLGKLVAHQDNHFAFPQPKLRRNGFERRTVLPGHFNDPLNLVRCKIRFHTCDNNAAAVRFQ